MMTRPCDALPPVRGSFASDAALKDLVWFRAGGPAEILFRPADAEDLATFLHAKPADLRVGVIGVGSNLLVRDGGIPGVVIRLPRRVRKNSVKGTAGARRRGRARCCCRTCGRRCGNRGNSNFCVAFPAPWAARSG